VTDSARHMAVEKGFAPDVAATQGLPSPVERRPSPAPGGSRPRSLSDPWTLGGLRVANRVVLAPLAGIGSWFVRLQAKRHGAGMAVSEMISSHAVHHRNPRTCEEMLRIHPDERAGGPTSIQLFGADPEIMRSAAARVAEAGADLIDLNMGCPVPKVCKTGAGAALLCDPDRAVAVARAAREGSGLPVTVKLRPGAGPGDRAGVELARRLVDEVGVAGLAFHPRAAAQHHKGGPDYELAAELVAELPVPVILSGGLRDAPRARVAFERTGAAGVMLARGSLGNPWLFAELLGLRDGPPDDDEILDELEWVMERAVEHHGRERAARNLRRFYPWYLERLGAPARLTQAMQCAPTVAEARRIVLDLRVRAAA
jgi:tRNA-dihydrouridine synthase B